MARSDCRHLRSPGDAFELQLVPPFDEHPEEHIIRAVASVFGEIEPVAQAIAADLILTCRGKDEPFLERGEVLAPGAFHLREADPPAHVRTVIEAATDPQLPVAWVPQLDAPTVARWIEESIRRPAAPSDLAVTLEIVRVGFSRARLYRIKPGETVFRLRWHDDTVEIPIEQKNEQAWVSAPIGWVSMLPAVAFQIINYNGALRATIWAGWSCWAERGHPEHDALEQALRRLVARGWTPELVPLAFDLGADAGAGGADR